MKLLAGIIIALVLIGCTESTDMVGPSVMAEQTTKQSKEQSLEKVEAITPSLLDEMDVEITILEMKSGSRFGVIAHGPMVLTRPILAFKFPTAAIEAAEILNDFLKENGMLLDLNRDERLLIGDLDRIITERLEELDFPTDQIVVGDLGCEFLTYTLPLRD